MSAPVLSSEPEYAQMQQTHTSQHSFDDVERIFSTAEIAKVIKEHNFERPCIQFCDSLVVDASKVAQLVEKECGIKVFILADTSYSPCCVDEVAAQHLKADVIFHLGNACLNPVTGVPVYYVLHKVDLNLDLLRTRLQDRKCVVYADTEYTFALENLDCVVAMPSKGDFVPPLPIVEGTSIIPNRVLSATIEDPSQYELVYLSASPSDSLMLYFASVFNGVSHIDISDSELPLNETRQFLRKRYRLVQMAKSAATVGILVNTLSLKHMRDLVDVAKKWIAAADKKYYTFTVGKPNVAKLANFEVIDVWVVLGCPLGGLLVDQDDYIKPIVTLFELKMALTFDWNGQWVIDLEQTLALDDEEEEKEKEEDEDNDPDAPHFDVVTGRLVNNAPMRQPKHVDLEHQQLVQATQALSVKNVTSTAAEHLRNRQWQGLGSDFSESAPEFAELKRGQSGIARDYSEDTREAS